MFFVNFSCTLFTMYLFTKTYIYNIGTHLISKFVYFFLARLQRHMMVDKDLEEIRDKVPGLKKGSSQLFRTLRDKGIISYTEYLFLLSVLTSK